MNQLDEKKIEEIVKREFSLLLGPENFSQWLLEKFREKRVTITASQFKDAFEKTGRYVRESPCSSTYCHSLSELMKELGF